MAATIGELAVNVVARTKRFTSGMARARKGMNRFGKDAKSMGKVVSRAMTMLLPAAGAGGLAVMFKKTADSIDATTKKAQQLGIATEKLMGLHHAAELSGISTNTLNMAIQRMVRRVSEAAKGTGEAQKAIQELGLDAQRLNALAPDQQLMRIARAMQAVESPADRLRLSFKFFDSEGSELVRMLNEGSAGLARMQKEADKLGKTIKDSDAKRIEKFNDALTRLNALFSGGVQKLVIEIAPAAEEAIKALTAAVSSKRGGRPTKLSDRQDLLQRAANSRPVKFLERITGLGERREQSFRNQLARENRFNNAVIPSRRAIDLQNRRQRFEASGGGAVVRTFSKFAKVFSVDSDKLKKSVNALKESASKASDALKKQYAKNLITGGPRAIADQVRARNEFQRNLRSQEEAERIQQELERSREMSRSIMESRGPNQALTADTVAGFRALRTNGKIDEQIRVAKDQLGTLKSIDEQMRKQSRVEIVELVA